MNEANEPAAADEDTPALDDPLATWNSSDPDSQSSNGQRGLLRMGQRVGERLSDETPSDQSATAESVTAK